MNVVSHGLEQQYEDLVAAWILDATKQGVITFEDLLLSLPGVYPTIVLDSLKRLASLEKFYERKLSNLINTSTRTTAISDSQRIASNRIELPIPHPLDYDWRFADEAIKHLTDCCLSLSQQGDNVVLLGIPSVFQMAGTLISSRQINLIDANPAILGALSKYVPPARIQQCNLLRDPLPQIKGSVIALDPPWYEQPFTAFLWAASHLCTLNGHLLVSFPPIGTRPGIEQEVSRLLEYAQKLGFILVDFVPANLPYDSPPFEMNALKAAGIYDFPRHWRRGDLALFIKTDQVVVSRPLITLDEDEGWSEEQIEGIRLRVKESDESNFVDPTLISVVEGDILPTVSRRDSRRVFADVWTTGNRIFSCKGRNVLCWILQALAKVYSPEKEVVARLGRDLTNQEVDLVSYATHQVMNVINLEKQEYQVSARNDAELALISEE